jgi:L-aspartate oxidase
LEIEHGLLRAVRSCATVAILEQHLATDVVLDRNGRCCGALVLPARGEPEFIRASVCLLATGGIGQVYEHTTNPQIATGDGVAVGYRAGAVIANMEFVQFHPTALFGHRVDGRAFLISEAVRGEGALLLARSGRRFMPDYHPDAELAPRDVVARAIANELHRGGDRFVLLDATGIGAERLRERFPTIYRTCLDIGVDMTAEAVPVVPAAHYVCGGVQTNGWGESTVPGLFAAGECACSGLHGANRLASNSLLEALVLADRAAERVLTSAVQPSAARSGAGVPRAVRAVTNESVQELRSLMWSSAGMVRSDAGLAAARHRLAELDSVREHPATALTAGAVESDNLLTVARLTVECAMRRPESRGLHYNENHPMPSDALAKDTLVSRSELESGC